MIDQIIQLFKKSYPSDKQKRKNTVDAVFKLIKDLNINPQISFDELYLIIDEAITNAMEHGNQWNADKKIQINVSLNSKNLFINISDEGGGFNLTHVQKELEQGEILRKRGRGIFIINKLCSLSWNNQENELTLTIPLED